MRLIGPRPSDSALPANLPHVRPLYGIISDIVCGEYIQDAQAILAADLWRGVPLESEVK